MAKADSSKPLADIKDTIAELKKLNAAIEVAGNFQKKKLQEQQKELKEILALQRTRYKEETAAERKSLEASIKQNRELNEMFSTMQAIPKSMTSFRNNMLDTVSISEKIKDSTKQTMGIYQRVETGKFAEVFDKAATSVADLSNLSKEDQYAIAAKNAEIMQSISLMDEHIQLIKSSANYDKIHLEQLEKARDTLLDNYGIAVKYASTSKEIKDVYSELYDDLDGTNKAFKKIATTIELMLNNGKAAAALLLYGIGKIVDEFGELGKEIGVGVTQMIGLKLQALAFSKIFGETSKDAVLELQAVLGDTRATTFGLNLDAATLAANYKLTGDQAAYIATAFGKVSGNSDEVGKNTLAFTKQLALSNGIMPSRAFQDIANSSEFVAKFTNESGKNIGTAAVAAGKLGVNLKTASTIANHLLDYQTSVDKEMEASVLLGREFNLQKARQLAYEGDIAGSLKEALNAAGGIDEFMSLDPIRRQAVADALGVSVDELQKMASQQKDLNGMNGVGAQIYSRIEETLQGIGNSLGGKIFNGLAAVILFAGQLNMAFMGTNFSIGKMVMGIWNGVKAMGSFIVQLGKAAAMKMGLMGPEMVMSKAGDMYRADSPQGKVIKTAAKQRAAKAAGESVASNITPPSKPIPTPTAGKAVGTTNSLGGINTTGLLKGAAAILIMAGALYVLGAALQQFNLVEPSSLLKMAGALIIVGAAMVGLSAIFANPILSAGLGIATLGILGFGAAIYMVGGGIKLFSEGVSILSAALPMLATNLAPLVSMILPIFGLAAAITALSISLAALSVSGTLALPVLAAVGLAAGAASAVFGGENGSSNNNSELLAEIRGLRDDLNSGKVAVNMDGKKVNTALAINNRRQVM
jgi:hypothetical protein